MAPMRQCACSHAAFALTRAVVVRRADHPGLDAETLVEWCRENMAAYKVPKIVDFVDALPKNGSGKIMWREVQDL